MGGGGGWCYIGYLRHIDFQLSKDSFVICASLDQRFDHLWNRRVRENSIVYRSEFGREHIVVVAVTCVCVCGD